MLGIRITVPVACFRKGLAREYLETEPLPPPATCYGFLLSLVGETRRARHTGARVCPALLNAPPRSTVLRTVWRVKNKPLGAAGNTRPDWQQLLTGVELAVWLDSSSEAPDPAGGPPLEDRVRAALDPARRGDVERFGGLSLGESTHLVDDVSLIAGRVADGLRARTGRAFLTAPRGRMTLPVWVDHVGSSGTRHETGDLVDRPACDPPPPDRMPVIRPHGA